MSEGRSDKTTLIANLALSIVQQLGDLVAIIDADLQFSDMAIFFDVEPVTTIVEATGDINFFSPIKLNPYFLPVAKNIQLLCGPRRLEYSELVDVESLTAVVRMAQTLVKRAAAFLPKTAFSSKLDATLRRTGLPLLDSEYIVATILAASDESAPMVDARLEDGSRVNIIISPLALDSAMVTIRKFSKSALTIRDLINFGTLDERMATFLEAGVKARLNILVSGGTGSGKTKNAKHAVIIHTA